jgi:hypothetical protein
LPRTAGDAYGRLLHLLDAADDRAGDDHRGRFNPLTATGTTRSDAHRLAQALSQQVGEALADVAMTEPDLAEVLLGPELERAVSRTFGAGHPQLALTGVLAAVTMFGFPRRRRRERRDDRGCGWACDCLNCCDCADVPLCDCC